MSACADKLLLLHGLVDGELDAANALSIEAHLRGCAGCAAEYERIIALRARIAAANLRERAPDALQARIAEAIADAPDATATTPRPRGWWQAATGAVGGLAAGVALMAAIPRPPPDAAGGIATELVADHVRSLLAGHLTDVQTSDQHLVKPWFNGKIDFAPAVPELAADGFPLAGGRLDYLDNRVVAAIVYHRRLHSINLFVWPGTDQPDGVLVSRDNGYNLVRWSQGGLTYWAVSDLNMKELRQFQQDFATRSAG